MEMRETGGISPVIGTGILGLVTVAMYQNPLAIYREYLQNSADAVAGTGVSEQGKVEIAIEPSGRRVRIRDNGPGLSYSDALHELIPIGRSNKQRGRDRGFRGIGRLAGLAFAESVTFLTRACGDDPVTRVTWSGSGLSSHTATESEVADVLRKSVSVTKSHGSEYPGHFFEVQMDGVARHAAGTLLNRDAVRRYVSEVCPVPMAPDFPFVRRIEELLRSNEPPLSLDITFVGDHEPVRRTHGKTIQLSANREDCFRHFEEIHIPSVERFGYAAVGWDCPFILLRSYPKSDPDSRHPSSRRQYTNRR